MWVGQLEISRDNDNPRRLSRPVGGCDTTKRNTSFVRHKECMHPRVFWLLGYGALDHRFGVPPAYVISGSEYRPGCNKYSHPFGDVLRAALWLWLNGVLRLNAIL